MIAAARLPLNEPEPDELFALIFNENRDPALADALASQGLSIGLEHDRQRAFERLAREQPEVVIVDLDASSLELCRELRRCYRGGIIVLSTHASTVDEILALELGADDFLKKPFEPRILLARVKSLVRRVGDRSTKIEPSRLPLGPLVVDRVRRGVFNGAQRVALTELELSLMWFLALHAGEVVTRDAMYQRCLGVAYDGLNRTIDIHVSRARRKLARHGFDPQDLRSIRGEGYLLVRRD